MNIETTLLEFVIKELLGPQAPEDLGLDEDLLTTGLVDSLGLMRMVSFIEKKYELRIPPDGLVIENFSSINAIASYVRSLRETKG